MKDPGDPARNGLRALKAWLRNMKRCGAIEPGCAHSTRDCSRDKDQLRPDAELFVKSWHNESLGPTVNETSGCSRWCSLKGAAWEKQEPGSAQG